MNVQLIMAVVISTVTGTLLGRITVPVTVADHNRHYQLYIH